MAVLPIDFLTWSVSETLQLADSLSKHSGIILLVDDPISKLVLFEKRRTKPVVPKPSAPFPADGFRNSALVCSVNNLLHARDNVRVTVFAQFNHDPSSAHLMP